MSLFFSSVFVLVHREWKRYLRQKSRFFSSILTPLLFWAMMGLGFGSSFQTKTSGDYLEYFFPGVLLMILLFSSIFSMMSLIEDRNEGFLQSVMVSPVSHTAIVFGKILGTATLSVFQAALFLPCAYFTGLSLNASIVIELLLAFLMISIFMSSLSFYFAWIFNSTQGFHGVMNVLLFPMWILSGSMFAMENSSNVMQWIMLFNPLTYALDAVRRILYMDLGLQYILSDVSVRWDMTVMLIFCVLLVMMDVNTVKKSYQN